jgi:hypothetical protein
MLLGQFFDALDDLLVVVGMACGERPSLLFAF